jgi:hypothetical protein
VLRLVRDEEIMTEDQDLTTDTEDSLPESTERPDGVVADSAEEEDDSASTPDADIDPAILESLLFSTHHPLTAGRIAELLDLDSTKPVRRGI